MKRVVLNFMMLFACVGFLASCGQQKAVVSQLAGKWTVASVKGEKLEMMKVPFFEFDLNENRVSGNAGCNNFNSSLILDEKDESAIKLTMAATTMMACPDMDKERVVLMAFQEIAFVKSGQKAGEILLTDSNGATIFQLVKD